MKVSDMKSFSASGTKLCQTKTKTLFVALATLIVSSTLLFAGNLPNTQPSQSMAGRYAIESVPYKGKFLRGLPEQQKDVVSAAPHQATVFQVNAENQPSGTYSLQSHTFFLSIEGGEHDVVMHKANGGREKFKIEPNGDGTYSLMAVWNKKYITVEQDGNVHSSATKGDNAKFRLHKK